MQQRWYGALTVAGSDSGGGAGIQADLKTFHRLGVFGSSVITCLTAQNTVGVRGIQAAEPQFVRTQLAAVLDDIPVAALKTGMLYSAEIIDAVAGVLRELSGVQISVDPVMVATSGDPLLKEEAVAAYKEKLFPLATLVTPNLHEAELLTGRTIRSEPDMKEAALELAEYGCRSVLIKGGHLEESKEAVDMLYSDGSFERLSSKRIELQSETHGSGCTLSAAITAYLAKGDTLSEACRKGKEFVLRAIQHARPLGKGAVVLDHWV